MLEHNEQAEDPLRDPLTLARHMLEKRNCRGITPFGVRVLCDAVEEMSAALAAQQAPANNDLAVRKPNGITTILYVSEANTDAAVRQKLIDMGWTPPDAPRAPAAPTIDLAGHHFDPSDLLRRAVRNLKAKRGGIFWATVRDTFATGGTVARALCEWAGRDPETGDTL